MNLIDNEENDIQKKATKKTKRIIITFIILLSVLCIAVVALILYLDENPNTVTTYIDGQLISGLDTILDIQKDEKGQTKIYIPIRDFASYLNMANPEFNYETYRGDYNPKTEDDTKCYIMRKDLEVAVFSEGSKTIYKLNLQSKSDDYEECTTDTDIFESGGKLYASADGIEQAYNVYISYEEASKTVKIYTLDYFIEACKTALVDKTIGEYGIMTLDDKTYANCKSIFDDLLIVKNSNDKYGILTADYSKFVLEPQYDDIDFVTDSHSFLVKSNNKVGLFSEDGKRKIDLIYDEITLMAKNSKLYMVKANNQYGVVDENGQVIIYPEYTQIGTDISDFAYNGVKNGYILLDTLIPVKQDEKWGFFNTSGKMISNGFKYSNIGCSEVRSGNNIYGLLQIPEHNVIVVQTADKKYGFMNTSGKDDELPFVFDEIFIKITGGEKSYWMKNNNKDYDVLEYLK